VAERTFDPGPRQRRWLGIGAALVTLLGVIGLWYRASERMAQVADGASDPGGLFLASQASGTSLTAVGRLDGLPLPCTGWLLDVAAPASAAAYAVTAGRCTGIDDAVTVLADDPVQDVTLALLDFAPVTSAEPSLAVPVSVERVVWASTRWRDLAILQLDATYGELTDRGIRAIRPVAAPDDGTAILVAGVPIDGIPAEERHLRGSRCTIAGSTDLLEPPWVFDDLRRSDCAGILGGSAGSAVFNPAGDAVAMVTTTTIGTTDDGTCAEGAPCEVGPAVTSYAPDTTYLTPVADLAECFPGGRFQLGAACGLEDPAGVVAAQAQAQSGAPRGSVTVTLDPARGAPDVVAAVQGRLGSVDCADPAAWGEPQPSQGWRLDLALPGEPGWALACVGSPEQPTPVLVRASAG
jgi:hypothetical protein